MAVKLSLQYVNPGIEEREIFWLPICLRFLARTSACSDFQLFVLHGVCHAYEANWNLGPKFGEMVVIE